MCLNVKLHLCRLPFMPYKVAWLFRIHLCRLVGIRLNEYVSQNKQNQPASCYYFIKITCNNKCYTQITLGVADYSKRQ